MTNKHLYFSSSLSVTAPLNRLLHDGHVQGIPRAREIETTFAAQRTAGAPEQIGNAAVRVAGRGRAV